LASEEPLGGERLNLIKLVEVRHLMEAGSGFGVLGLLAFEGLAQRLDCLLGHCVDLLLLEPQSLEQQFTEY